MLFKTALKNLKKSPLMNIICLLQLTAVFIIAAVMVSTMSVRYQTYTPLKKILSGHGIFSTYHHMLFGAIQPGGNFNVDAIFSTEELCGYVNADDAVVIRAQTMGMPDVNTVAMTYFYDDELLRRWDPGIKRGRWPSADADVLEIVINEGAYGLDVGDEAEFILHTYHNPVAPQLKVKVVGVLKDDANILGERGYGDYGDPIYRNLYRSLDTLTDGSSMNFFCASHSALQKHCPTNEVHIIAAFYTYGDDVSDEEITAAMQTSGRMNSSWNLRLESLNQNSKAYLRDELMKLLPIVVILLILTTVSSISTSAISARRRLKDYAKYYVIGLRWRQCALVNFFQALTVGLAAMLIACAGLLVISTTALAETFFIIWNAPVILTLLGILAFYLVFSMIMPLLMLRSVTPKALLQSE